MLLLNHYNVFLSVTKWQIINRLNEKTAVLPGEKEKNASNLLRIK
jgi:hypothetical protein